MERPAPGAGELVRADKDGCRPAAPGRPPVHVPGFPVTAVDCNGAGDAHVGAFLALLGQGHAPWTATRGANAAAGCAVTRRGPATAPDRGDRPRSWPRTPSRRRSPVPGSVEPGQARERRRTTEVPRRMRRHSVAVTGTRRSRGLGPVR
ncbi:PfkB family carbohydrate kinase [Streptomyces sp. NPDC101225]|uniref:PfkB family carbohydrate kinase n=1 Tax=Streptomyces sp. NPDC101225 TaxID=3366135 RepID=UPI00380532C5